MIPGSRFLPNVRLIAPDRPGFGQTDFVEGVNTIENWPNDIVALADSLGIDQFAIFAPSGGGPFALSCAWKIPERLTSVGIFASVGPLIPETDKNLAAPIRMMWAKAPKFPRLFKLQMKMSAWIARKFTKLYIKMIPNCEAEFIKGAGHFWLFEHLAEMLEKLVNGNWSDSQN